MRLTLRVTRAPADLAIPPRALTGGSLRIGRGDQNDWVLPDPQQHISKQHCTVALHGGQWLVQDNSSFGTFVNADIQPVGHGRTRTLRDGDRLRLGLYELDIRIVTDATMVRSDTESLAQAGRDAPDMLAEDPFGAQAGPAPPSARPTEGPRHADIEIVRAFLRGEGLPNADPTVTPAALGRALAAGLQASLETALHALRPARFGGDAASDKAVAWDRYVAAHAALSAEPQGGQAAVFEAAAARRLRMAD